MSTRNGTITHSTASEATRWGQLIFGIICMVMIANLQYGWTLFVGPIDQKYNWGRAAIQVAFTIFVLTETWLVPIEGYLIDRFGPRIMVSASGVLVAIAWVINSIADSLFLLYVGAAIGPNCATAIRPPDPTMTNIAYMTQKTGVLRVSAGL